MIKAFLEKIHIKRAFSAKVRMSLYNNLSFRASANMAIDDSIDKFSELFNSKRIKTGHYLALASEEIKAGSAFSSAIKKYIPPSEYSIIHAGEQNTDTQSESFNDVAGLVEYMDELYDDFRRTIVATVVKITVIFIFLISMGTAAVDVLGNLDLQEVPWFTDALIAFGTNVSAFWYLYAIGMVFSLGFLAYRIPRGAGKLRSWLQYRVFPFTIYRKMNSTAFLISFGSLINNNFSVDEALDTLRASARPYLKHYLDLMHDAAEAGMDAETIFSHDFFDPFLQVNLIDLVSINATGEAIKKLSRHELKATKKEFEKVNSRITTAILLLMAVVVLWGFGAFMIPILDTASNISTAI